MKIKVLASGSKGNATYLESKGHHFLIDAGINYITFQKRLEEIPIMPKQIEGIFITHNHTDHIKGLASFVKKTGCRVFVPPLIAEQLSSIIAPEYLFLLDETTELFDMKVELIPTSHDAPGSVGYKFQTEQKTIIYMTDTGYINEKQLRKMKNADLYVLESNHDEQMLMEGPYPYYLKQRVISDMGHLSNHTAAKYLVSLLGDKTKCIVLAHLSETNNTEELAYQAITEELEKQGIVREIHIAKQYESLDCIEV